jgi:hypothetical protein
MLKYNKRKLIEYGPKSKGEASSANYQLIEAANTVFEGWK